MPRTKGKYAIFCDLSADIISGIENTYKIYNSDFGHPGFTLEIHYRVSAGKYGQRGKYGRRAANSH